MFLVFTTKLSPLNICVFCFLLADLRSRVFEDPWRQCRIVYVVLQGVITLLSMFSVFVTKRRLSQYTASFFSMRLCAVDLLVGGRNTLKHPKFPKHKNVQPKNKK
jgi:hypothetical protein